MENLDQIKHNWHETKEKLKKQFIELTDKDLLIAEGKLDEVLEGLQKKLGKTREELHKHIAGL
jgi:uncharacterized protein YjbJ (UPF0337 family)